MALDCLKSHRGVQRGPTPLEERRCLGRCCVAFAQVSQVEQVCACLSVCVSKLFFLWARRRHSQLAVATARTATMKAAGMRVESLAAGRTNEQQVSEAQRAGMLVFNECFPDFFCVLRWQRRTGSKRIGMQCQRPRVASGPPRAAQEDADIKRRGPVPAFTLVERGVEHKKEASS